MEPTDKVLNEPIAETAFHAVNIPKTSPKSRKKRLSGEVENAATPRKGFSMKEGRRGSLNEQRESGLARINKTASR